MRFRKLHKNIQKFLSVEPSREVKVGVLIAFSLTVIISFYLASLYSYGPAFLADEIGYLSKGAAYARYITDGASSYHGGYSIFLAPVFLIFSDPFLIWKGIILVNCLLFTGSFILLYHLLRRLYTNQKFWPIIGALVACAVYPTWIVMSGYAFATPAFVFTFVTSVLLLTSIRSRRPFTALPFGIAVGFLYWIHIIGLGVLAAGLAILILYSASRNRWGILVVYCLSAFGMAILYHFFIHNLMNSVMTPTGFAAVDHYGAIEELLSSKLLSLHFWFRVGVLLIGQSAYMIVASLGLVGFSLAFIANSGFQSFKKKVMSKEGMIHFFMVLSLISVLLLGSILFSLQFYREGSLRPDHWMYGRYTGMVLLPLIGSGMLLVWRRNVTLVMAIMVWVTGFLLFVVTDGTNTSDFNNIINTVSFWPQYFIANVNYLTWFTLGSIGILAVFTLGKRLMILLLFFLMIISLHSQQKYHAGILSLFSKPSSGLINFMRESDAKCISFREYEYPSYEWQRINMYNFYFYDFRLERSSFDDWKANQCDFYLSFDEEHISTDQKLIGQENAFVKNLYLYTHKDYVVNQADNKNSDFIYKE